MGWWFLEAQVETEKKELAGTLQISSRVHSCPHPQMVSHYAYKVGPWQQ